MDKGWPVLVGGASHQGCGNWSLVIGYDQSHTELCHNGLDGEPPGTWSPIRGLVGPINDRDGAPGYWNGRPRGTVVPGFHGGWLVNPVFAVRDQGPRPAPRDLALTVLRRAVALHNAAAVQVFGRRHYFGAEAYRQWLAALPTMAGPADLILDELVRGRAAAAAFCESACTWLPQGAAELRQAAAAYRQEVATAQAGFAGLIPFRWDNPRRGAWGLPGERQAAGRAVAAMLEREETAVSAIRQALAAAGSSVP